MKPSKIVGQLRNRWPTILKLTEQDREMPQPQLARGGKKRGDTPFLGTGTRIAIKAKATSGRSFDVIPSKSAWGGSRNRADRTSCALSPAQVELLIGAAQHSLQIGLPFNRHITIHWQAAGIPDSRAAAMTGKILKKAADWVDYAGGQFAAAWVRENGHKKGSHVHILAHVPSDQSRGFFRMLLRWLRAIRLTSRHERGTILTQRIGGSMKASETSPDHYLVNLWNVVSYLAKGSSPAIITKQGLVYAFQPGGTTIGKRAGTTQNIGRAAWRRAGWPAGQLTFVQIKCDQLAGEASVRRNKAANLS